jgi:tetratricopeptide (TPR) repeat protein
VAEPRVTLYDLGEIDEAVAAYRTAIQQRKGSYAEAHYNLGNALYARGEIEESVKAYETAIEQQNGNFPDAQRNLGNALARLGDLDGATESIKRAISQGDTGGDAHHDLGLILHGRGQLDEAIREFETALEMRGGNDAEAHRNLGRALYQIGKLDLARAEFETAIRQREGDATKRPCSELKTEELTSTAIGKDSAAADTTLQLRVPHPRPPSPRLTWIWDVLYDLGESDPAIVEFRTRDCAARSVPAHYELGRALTRAGQQTEAMAELKKAIAQQGGVFAEAYFHMGLLLSRQGDSDGAGRLSDSG